MAKNYREDFFKLYNKLKNNEPFAFGRFSDGEMYIMQNKKLVLSSNLIQIGDQMIPGAGYTAEDHKLFDPALHSFYKDKLIEAYQFKKPNYYKGLSCSCCVGDGNFKWMVEMYGEDDGFLTWSNLWVNSNYPLFIEYMVPEFSNHKIMIVCNERANFSQCPFKIEKDFRIGNNCLVNDYGLIEKIKQYITENNITNHVFLFAASTLSNFLAHQLFAFNDKNWYIDIGTTLNKYIGMRLDRGYLQQYWGGNAKDLKTCHW